MESHERESRAQPPSQEECERKREPERDQEEAMLYCPVCNHRLTNHRCKLVCERCGYFMSCADYY
jgi:hypothetical protein